jgi:DNA-binding transcriptional regulator LsrR (DeoR family)
MARSDRKLPDTKTAPPAESGGDPIRWAAWLYYGEAMTQNDVALALGVSRATVANYLAEARHRGLVTISLSPDILEQVSLGRKLSARFGLQGAFVAPPPPVSMSPTEAAIALRRRLGLAASTMIAPWLEDGLTIGVAWGRTMFEMAHALPERQLPNTDIVQVSGSSLGDAESSPEACTVLIAGRLGARCRNLHAPAVVTNTQLYDALLAEPALKRHFGRIEACDLAIFGVGELGPGTTWSDTDFLPPSVVEDYLARKSVGVLIGRFIDRSGAEVPGRLTGRQIGLSLEALRAIPVRICVAGGETKQPAIAATLAGGYATHLVTDAGTAKCLLENTL